MSKDIVNEIIEECIEADLVFTHRDIATEASERGSTLSTSAIKQIVMMHRYPLYYQHSQVLQSGIVIDVIHPSDKSAENYELDDGELREMGPVPTKQIRKSPEITITADLPRLSVKDDYRIVENLLDLTPNSNTKSIFDKRGRYSVQAADVRMAGLDIGDVVYIVVGMGYVTLTKNPPEKSSMANFGRYSDIGVAGSLTVDRYFNLRVKDKFLTACLHAVPVGYGGSPSEIKPIRSITSQPDKSSRSINLYPKT